jgi:hypothetical protein
LFDRASLLGLFAFPPNLIYALEAHLRWLEATEQVFRARDGATISWSAVWRNDTHAV